MTGRSKWLLMRCGVSMRDLARQIKWPRAPNFAKQLSRVCNCGSRHPTERMKSEKRFDYVVHASSDLGVSMILIEQGSLAKLDCSDQGKSHAMNWKPVRAQLQGVHLTVSPQHELLDCGIRIHGRSRFQGVEWDMGFMASSADGRRPHTSAAPPLRAEKSPATI